MSNEPYDPLARKNLAASVAEAMLAQEATVLPPGDRFLGAGIYAIYFSGSFPLYRPVARANKKACEWPIYVGKAVPKGRRKGLEPSLGANLYNRLVEHADSIAAATNLELADFECRWLVVEDIWIPLAESFLIHQRQPIWNTVVEGFGIHNPGSNRAQRKSAWDTIHPGRTHKWKVTLKPHKKSVKEIRAAVKAAVEGR